MNVVAVIYNEIPQELVDFFNRIIFAPIKMTPMAVDIESRTLCIDPNHSLFLRLTIEDILYIILHESGHISTAPITREIQYIHRKKANAVIKDDFITKFLIEYVYDYIIDNINQLHHPTYANLNQKSLDQSRETLPDVEEVSRILMEARFAEPEDIQGEKAKEIRAILDDARYNPVPDVVIKIYEALKQELEEMEQNALSCALICPFAGVCDGNCVLQGEEGEQGSQSTQCPHPQDDQQTQEQQSQTQSQSQSTDQQQDREGSESATSPQVSQPGEGTPQPDDTSQTQGDPSQDGGDPSDEGEGEAEDTESTTSGEGDEETETEGEGQEDSESNQPEQQTPRRLTEDILNRIRNRTVEGETPEVIGRVELNQNNPVVRALTYGEREELREELERAEQEQREAQVGTNGAGNPLGGAGVGGFGHRVISHRVKAAMGAMQMLEQISESMANVTNIKQFDFRSGEPYEVRDLQDLDEISDVTDPMELILQEEMEGIYVPQVYDRRDDEQKRNVLILRDRSSSINEGNKDKFTKATVVGLMEAFRRKKIKIGFGEFNRAIQIKEVNGNVFTKEYGELMLLAVSGVNAGGTNIPSILAKAVISLKNEPQFDIILVSDGESTAPPRTLIKTLQKKDIHIYSIFIGGRGASRLRDLAVKTGGKYYQTAQRSDSDLIEILTDIDRRITPTI